MTVLALIVGFCVEHPWIACLIGGCIFASGLSAAACLWGCVIDDAVD